MKYDAVAFLESLFRPAAVMPASLPGDWFVLWDERAAILEYDGGLSRERAEALALVAVVDLMTAAGEPPQQS
jgi:hypothetical protein